MGMRFCLSTVLLALLGLAQPPPSRGEDAGELNLAKKAAVFEHDMEARFLLDGQALCKLKRPTPERDYVAYNMPDNAYMTGIYLGTMSMKYAVTKADADREKARRSLRALHLLCTVSGKKGLLSRAAWPADRPMDDDGLWRDSPDGKHRWRGDVSSDQVDGTLFGFALAYDLVANDAEKTLIAEDVGNLVGAILDNNLRIIGYDGNVTTWGKYYPEYAMIADRLNMLLWLQALKVAHHVTGEARFEAAYTEWAFAKNYAKKSVYSRRHRNPNMRAVNHSDDVLIFLGYEPVLRYEENPELREFLLAGLKDFWDGNAKYPGVAPEANPLYAFLVARYLDKKDAVPDAINTLRWFPLDMKWNRDTIAQYEKTLEFRFDPAPKSPEPEKKKPLPVDRRPKSWSAWVMDPYRPGGDSGVDSPIEFNGHDYLLGYWMGRYYGFIGTED